MRTNVAKQRMRAGKPALGASAVLGAVLSAELLAQAGFDFVLVDNQHGAWDDRETFFAFRSIWAGGAVPMARVRQNDFGLIGRLLDAGALGVVVPMVHTAEAARAAVQAARYPPLGGRSAGAFGAGIYEDDYFQRANDEVFLAVQIESEQAVHNAEAILGVEGVDGCWIGPTDLAFSLGVEIGAPAHQEAIRHVLETCRRVGKIPGIASGPDARTWLEMGFLFVTAGSDFAYVVEQGRRTLEALRAWRV